MKAVANISIGLLCTAFFAVAAVVVACDAFGGGDDKDPAQPPSLTDADTDTGSNTEAGVEQCSAPPHNLAGCLCGSAGVTQNCYQGVPGANSACDTPGSQSCTQGADGKLRWSPCVGGAMPKPEEECFDGVDNNCDGKVGEGCACTDDVALCKDPSGNTYAASSYTIFTRPAEPKANVEFDLFIITKDKPLIGPGLLNGGQCYGGGLAKPCATPGKGCDGWKVAAFHNLKEPAGTHNFSVTDPNGEPACSGIEIASKSVVVSP